MGQPEAYCYCLTYSIDHSVLYQNNIRDSFVHLNTYRFLCWPILNLRGKVYLSNLICLLRLSLKAIGLVGIPIPVTHLSLCQVGLPILRYVLVLIICMRGIYYAFIVNAYGLAFKSMHLAT